ncbi:retinal cone rhodopsin-sensitive cGMP 3',5'-cyclic phosphodiesterase subunit gamma isoform X3 [Manis javanica]
MSDSSAQAPPASDQGPTAPRKGPPKFKQRQTRQFKSKPPKKGVKGFGDDIPGMEGLGTGPDSVILDTYPEVELLDPMQTSLLPGCRLIPHPEPRAPLRSHLADCGIPSPNSAPSWNIP